MKRHHVVSTFKIGLSGIITPQALDVVLTSKVEGRVSCIPNNTEKYISFSLGQLRFIDSAQFLLASPDKLVAANPPEVFLDNSPT